jgi:hypothetical protein
MNGDWLDGDQIEDFLSYDVSGTDGPNEIDRVGDLEIALAIHTPGVLCCYGISMGSFADVQLGPS